MEPSGSVDAAASKPHVRSTQVVVNDAIGGLFGPDLDTGTVADTFAPVLSVTVSVIT